MASSVSFSDTQTSWKDGNKYTAGADIAASVSYKRDGTKVTLTVKITADGWGHYSQAHFATSPNGSAPASSAYTAVIEKQDESYSGATWTKTYTYDDSSAKTYYFYVKSYVQTLRGYDGQWSDVHMFSIDVPAGGAIPWVKVNGQWRRGTCIYTKVNGAWRKGIARSKASGTWKM